MPPGSYVRVANGSRLPVAGTCKVGVLRAVLHVPSIALNLISVPQLDREGNSVLFKSGFAYINNTKFGALTDKLYTTSLVELDDTDLACAASAIEDGQATVLSHNHKLVDQRLPRDLDLLHRRFGHANVSMLKRMIAYGSARGMEVSAYEADPNRFHCEACSLSKAHQHKRIKNKRKTDGPLHTDRTLYFRAVYSDVLGPVTPVAVGNYEYGVTFTEAETRYRPLKQKSDVLACWKQVVTEVKSLGFKIALLRSDNGGEYMNAEFAAFMAHAHISHRFTSPNTPQANHLAERYNKTLNERARAMLQCVPRYLWAEAMLTTTYIYNRSLSPSDQSATRTPYELLFGVVPDVSNLRAFGCVAYMYNFAQDNTKLDNEAIRGTFVGYCKQSASYLIFVHEQMAVKRSGHVDFNEHAMFFSKELKASDDLVSIGKTKEERSKVRKLNYEAKEATKKSIVATAASRVGVLEALVIPSVPPALQPPDLTPLVVPPIALPVVPSVTYTGLSSTTVPKVLLAPIDPDGQLVQASASISVPPKRPRPSKSATTVQPAVGPPKKTRTLGPSVVSSSVDNTGVETFASDNWQAQAPTLSYSQRKRRQRARQPPERLRDDNHCYFTGDEVESDFTDELLNAAIADPNFVGLLYDEDDVPTSYSNISTRADKNQWYAAVDAENRSILLHGVMVPISEVPLLKNIIKAKYF